MHASRGISLLHFRDDQRPFAPFDIGVTIEREIRATLNIAGEKMESRTYIYLNYAKSIYRIRIKIEFDKI